MRDDFDAVYTRYFPRLWKFASRFVGPQAAEEVVQDVMFNFWMRRDANMSERELTAFLYSAVRRRSWDVLRHNNVVERTENEAVVNEVSLAMGESVLPPDEHIANDEISVALNKAMQTLPDRTQAILQLRWGEGMAYDQIAGVLGISITAAKVQMSRARRVLAPLLERFRD